MRIALLAALVLVGAGCKRHDPKEPAKVVRVTAPGSAAPGSAAPGSAAPATAAVPSKPVALVRHHTIGQRYALHQDQRRDGDVLVIDGTATVTDVQPDAVTFDVAIDHFRSTGNDRTGLGFKVVANLSRPVATFDAEQTSGPRAEAFLVNIEMLLGALCGPPTGAHLPGDRWTEPVSGDAWQLTAYDAQGGLEFASYEATETTEHMSMTARLRLATDDAFTGGCDLVTTQNIGELKVTTARKQTVQRLP